MSDNLLDPSVLWPASDLSDETTNDATVEAPEGEPEEIEEDEVDAEESETDSEELEDEVFELDGEEFTPDQVLEWKKSHDNAKSMQADATKKWQEAAEMRKQAEAQSQGKLGELISQLDALIEDESLTERELDELREDDREAYWDYKDKMSKRKDLLAKAKKSAGPIGSSVDVQKEQAKLWDAHKEWGTPDAPTDQFKKDSEMVAEYVKKQGYTEQDAKEMITARELTLLLKAAKFDQLESKREKGKTLRKKSPKITKPKAKSKAQPTTLAEAFYGKT